MSKSKEITKNYKVIIVGGFVVVVVLTSSAFALGKQQVINVARRSSVLNERSTLAASDSEDVAFKPFYAQGRRGGQNGQGRGRAALASIQEAEKYPLEAADEAGLVKMREEEKLARDVYLTLAKEYDLRVFSNIARAEQRHMDAIGTLLAKYEIKDPVLNDEVGVFSDPEMQSLYNDLVAKGKQSSQAALEVGATIEDLDIYDLDNLIKETKNPDVKFVYERLNFGSENHMRAFTSNLKELGVSYQPQYIIQVRYQEIINSKSNPRERS